MPPPPILQRDRSGWHLVSQPRALLSAVRHDRFVNAPVELLLRAIGSADKPLEARDLQEQIHQAHPTGAHCGTDQVERQDQAIPALVAIIVAS